MGVLSRDDFFNLPEPKRERVAVPALGGDVFVRQITAGERDDFERGMRAGDGKHLRPLIVALVTVDEDGKPLFSAKDLGWLASKPVAALEPILNAHARLNYMSADDMAELEKN